MYIKENKKHPFYISKHNSVHEKQIILLIIPNEEKEEWHHLAVIKLSALLHGITYCITYCLNCLHSFRTENKLKSH